jgi:hypothetical protein
MNVGPHAIITKDANCAYPNNVHPPLLFLRESECNIQKSN